MRALLVVDVQNDFAHPNGSLYVTDGNLVAGKVNDLIKHSYITGHYDGVIYSRDYHPNVTPHFNTHGGPWPPHCVAGTWGAEYVSELIVNGPEVLKGTGGEDGYSAFTVRDDSGQEYATNLHSMLQERGVLDVDVCGIALDVCVKGTALDSVRLGYRTNLLLDATASVDKLNGERAVLEMVRAGVHIV